MAINGELMFPNYATSTVVQCVRGEVSATTKESGFGDLDLEVHSCS